MKCPQCHIEATQVGAYWICGVHGPLPEPKPFAPLRIFLSYGHDANEPLVRRITSDLEARGHDVWFDKAEIKAGDDWRRSITDGITQSHKFVSFLSKHSTRDPGVCRDEIAIAIGVKGGNIQTILVENEQEVQPPVNIGHIQWLDMHDWKEQRERGSGVPPEDANSWEQWYQAKLAEIVQVVESDESRRFAGEIETLNGHLKPIKSEARICQLLGKGFYGRQWLFEAVENWRTGGTYNVEPETKNQEPRTSPSRLFWIMGAPGVGKSAFSAQLIHTRGDTVIAAQFCEWDKPDHRNAPRVVRSLAFQLATRLPDYRKLLLTLPEIAELDRKDAAELFDYLLANPLRSVIHGGRERYLIVIDALDEAGEAGRNPLVEMLARNAQRLPDWLGLVVTSRPEFDVKTPLQALNPFPLDTQSESNRADIRDYLRRELASPLQNRPDAARLVEQILEKSEGVFLYVERFCDGVQRGHLSLDRPVQFPQGLGGIFADYFKRQFPDLEKFRKDVRPALRAILAAREPLPVEFLQRLFNWQDEELRDFTRPIASLFPVTKEANGKVIKPYHKSLAEWLENADKAGDYFASVHEGDKLLADACWREYKQDQLPISCYTAAHLPRHLAQTQRWDNLFSMVMSPVSGLLSRWVDQGDAVDGLFCLTGLAKYFQGDSSQAVSAGAVATQIARIHSRQGNYVEARSCLEHASAHTSWLRGRRIRAIALHELASLHLYSERFAQAATAYRRALLLCFLGVPVYCDEAAANLIGLGGVAIGQCRNSLARHLAIWASRQAAFVRDHVHQRAAMRLAAAACLPLGRYNECRRWLQQAGAFIPPTDVEQTRAWVLLGCLEFSEATLAGIQPDAAVATFEGARQSALIMRDIYSLIEAELGLAWCALTCQTADVSRWLGQAAKRLTTGSNFELWGWHMFLVAAQRHQTGMPDALTAYASTEEFCRQHAIPSWLARALVGQGAIRWHQGDPATAKKLWDTAWRTSRRVGKGLSAIIKRDIETCQQEPTNIPQ